MSGDEQKVLAAAIAVVTLLLVWFGWLALRAFRRRRPHSRSVTEAAEKVLAMDEGQRPEKIELTEHLARFMSCEPPLPGAGGAVGKRGYLALTDTHLAFAPYHRAEPIVLQRGRLGDPGSKYREVWKKSAGTFTLTYGPPGSASTRPDSVRVGDDSAGDDSESDGSHVLTFKVRQPYTWLFKFGFRSGLSDDPYS